MQRSVNFCQVCGGEIPWATDDYPKRYARKRYCSQVCINKKQWEYRERSKTTSGERYKAWYERNKDTTRQQKTELMRKYRAENPEKYRKQTRDAKALLRKRLFEMYGHTCAVCGFSDKRALTLDHINQNGSEERRLLGERGVYRRALAEYRPDEYRTLCMNCQFIERSK